MAHDARAIANLILDTAEVRGYEVSNLKLQKLLFFAHARHLVVYNERLILQAFEAWDHGPVVRLAYNEFKENGANAIIDQRAFLFDIFSDKQILASAIVNKDEEESINETLDNYGNLSASTLRNITHEAGGPWDLVSSGKTFSPGSIIDDHLIRSYMVGKH